MHDHDKQAATGSKSWVVANSHANQECVAIDQLTRQGYDTYCPMILKRRSHARRVEEVQRPLFPCYVFVRIDRARERWRPILSTVGVRTLVHFGESLGTVRDEFIHSLRQREKDGVIVRPETPYHIGQQVRLSTGPFDGVVATILSMDEKDRLVVLMDMLQRQVRVQIRADQIIAE